MDDNGEDIIHEMGKRVNCAIVELNGVALFLPLLPEKTLLKRSLPKRFRVF